MTFEQLQETGYKLTRKERAAVTRQMVVEYKEAIKKIDKQLKAAYLKLSDIPKEEYYNYMSRFNRLRRLLISTVEEYKTLVKKSGLLLKQSSELAFNNQFYRAMFQYSWAEDVSQVFAFVDDRLLETVVYGNPKAWSKLQKIYGDRKDYLPQAGTLLDTLIAKRAPETIERLQRAIRQSLIAGEGYQKTARTLRDIMTTDLNKALRIARSEGHRNMCIAHLAASEDAKAQGLNIRRKIIATLDDRTRPQSAQVDGLLENKDGYFVYPGGRLVRTPGNSGVPGWDINDREIPVSVVDGLPPTVRRARNPVTGETDIISYKDFPEWAKENGLKKNRYGQLLPNSA